MCQYVFPILFAVGSLTAPIWALVFVTHVKKGE